MPAAYRDQNRAHLVTIQRPFTPTDLLFTAFFWRIPGARPGAFKRVSGPFPGLTETPQACGSCYITCMDQIHQKNAGQARLRGHICPRGARIAASIRSGWLIGKPMRRSHGRTAAAVSTTYGAGQASQSRRATWFKVPS